MGELANYSIETDHTVLLQFKDGRSFRVSSSQLHRHLAPADQGRISAAMKLRQDFLRRHMPKAVVILVVSGFAALLLTGSQVVARLWHPAPPPTAVPEPSDVVRSIAAPSPSVSPVPRPSIKDASTPAVAAAPVATAPTSRSARRRTPSRPVSPVLKPAESLLRGVTGVVPKLAENLAPLPAPITLPQSSPAPLPDSTPAPSPTVSPSPLGQVLGDGTGPSSGSSD